MSIEGPGSVDDVGGNRCKRRSVIRSDRKVEVLLRNRITGGTRSGAMPEGVRALESTRADRKRLCPHSRQLNGAESDGTRISITGQDRDQKVT